MILDRAIACGVLVLVIGGCPFATDSDRRMANTPPDATSGGSTARACGGPSRITCPADSYCNDGTCGLSSAEGQCVEMPAQCEPGGTPVCGCDGRVYANACEATRTTGKSRCYDEGSCAPGPVDAVDCQPDEGFFACGAVLCRLETEYCARTPCADGGVSFRCQSLPAACGAIPDCGCLGPLASADCFQGLNGGLSVEFFDASSDC